MTHSDQPTPLEARASGALTGKVRVPGDKSISHRALILGALSVGETRVSGLLEGEDVLNTARSMQALGARVERTGPFAWSVRGVGVAGFAEPAACAGIAEIKRSLRLSEPGHADAAHQPLEIAGSLDCCAERSHCVRGIHNVFALKQARNPGFADRQRA